MGIENLGNNDFGKLQLTNLNNAKAQKNSKDLANEQIKKEELKNINLNQGVLQAGQTDLAQAYFNNDTDIAKGGDNSEQPTTKMAFNPISFIIGIVEFVDKVIKFAKGIKDAKQQGLDAIQNGNNLAGVGGAVTGNAATPVFGSGAGVTGGGLN